MAGQGMVESDVFAAARPTATTRDTDRRAVFAGLGFLIVDDFFDGARRAALVDELRQAPRRRAPMYDVKDGWAVAEQRSAKHIAVSQATVQDVGNRLSVVMPSVAGHFETKLTACEPIQFVGYEVGDYITYHVDGSSNLGAIDQVRERKVSVIVTVNEQTSGAETRDDTYAGGDLVFRLRLRGSALIPVPFPVQPGMLIAFRPDAAHEVRKVTGGNRYSIVTWFH